MSKKYTLITGACKGIGRSIAEECARRNMNLLLVSNDRPCLESTVDSIRKSYPISCEGFHIDLTEPDAPQQVYNWSHGNGYAVDILINNVGIGKGGKFRNMLLKDFHYMMNLNNRVLIEMTHFFLPELEKHEKAYILNTSSIEATLPLPYKTVYTATKNFIYAFSLALGEELKFQHIQVSVLCPGPVLTNADGLTRLNAHGKRSKLLLMYPDQVAKIAVSGMLRGRKIIVPGRLNTFFFKLGSLVPTTAKMSLLERLFRVYKDH